MPPTWTGRTGLTDPAAFPPGQHAQEQGAQALLTKVKMNENPFLLLSMNGMCPFDSKISEL